MHNVAHPPSRTQDPSPGGWGADAPPSGGVREAHDQGAADVALGGDDLPSEKRPLKALRAVARVLRRSSRPPACQKTNNSTKAPGAQQVFRLAGVQQVIESVGDCVQPPAPVESGPDLAPVPGQSALPWGRAVGEQLYLMAVEREAAGDERRGCYARKQAQRLCTCGMRAEVACIRCGVSARELKHVRCESRACGYCASTRADEVRDKALRVAAPLLAECVGGRVFMLTLTTRKPRPATFEYIDAAYGFISAAVSVLWRRLKRRGAIGALGGFETGEGGMVHLHLAVVAPWSDDERAKLEREVADWWCERTTKAPGMGVSERARQWLRLARGHEDGLPLAEAFALAVRECVAYCVGGSARPGECDNSTRARLGAWTLVALCGRRRLRAYGVFHGIGQNEEREPGCDDEKEPTTCECCGGRVFTVVRVLEDDDVWPTVAAAPAEVCGGGP